jgi:hypothetical protein
MAIRRGRCQARAGEQIRRVVVIAASRALQLMPKQQSYDAAPYGFSLGAGRDSLRSAFGFFALGLAADPVPPRRAFHRTPRVGVAPK